MAALLFLRPENAAYYVSYVVTFNLLVGPVFSPGASPRSASGRRSTCC